MTVYSVWRGVTIAEVVGWRIPYIILWLSCFECASLDTASGTQTPDICIHPQAQGKPGGWLKECPKKKESDA